MRQRLVAFGVGFLIACTGHARAACGPGKVPSYSDISGLRYARTDCFGKCPSYEVLIWELGLYYVGRTYVDRPGTYAAGIHLLRCGLHLTWYPQAFLMPSVATRVAEIVEYVAAVVVVDSANRRYQASELKLRLLKRMMVLPGRFEVAQHCLVGNLHHATRWKTFLVWARVSIWGYSAVGRI